jgi:hypothetical protein
MTDVGKWTRISVEMYALAKGKINSCKSKINADLLQVPECMKHGCSAQSLSPDGVCTCRYTNRRLALGMTRTIRGTMLSEMEV